MSTETIEVLENEDETENKSLENTFKQMSPFLLVMRRFFRSKLSIVGIVMIVGLFLFSFLGPVVYTAWGEEEVDRRQVIQEIVNVYTYTDKDGKEITVTQVLEHVGETNTYAGISSDHLLGIRFY